MSRTGGRSFAARLAFVERRLRPLTRRHRRWLVRGALGTLLVVACRLAFPWPLRGLLELAYQGRETAVTGLVPAWGDPVAWLGGAFVAIVLLQGFGELVQRLSFARFAISVVHGAREQALASVARAPGERAPGDAIARVIGDSARFKSGLKGVLIRMTQNGTFFVGVCAMLLMIDLRLGLAFVAGGSLILVVAGLGAVRVAEITRRLRKKEGRLADHMHAVLQGRAEIGGSGSGEQEVASAEAKTTKLEGLFMWSVHALLAATTCTVIVLGLHGVRAGRLAPGDLFTVLFYLLLVHNPTVRLGRQAVRLGRMLASAERLVKLVGEETRPARARVGAGHAAGPIGPGRQELRP